MLFRSTLDPDSGQILNSDLLGLRRTGVATGTNGLPITDHQLGFVPPAPEIIVRKAGEPTTGYAEHAWSMINRYQFDEGTLRGFVVGVATVYQQKFRAYRFTDAADANKRKTFYYPDRCENNLFMVYSFKAFSRTRMSLQLNVDNVLDVQRVIALPRSTTAVPSGISSRTIRTKSANFSSLPSNARRMTLARFSASVNPP